jgi:hypothetical protein
MTVIFLWCFFAGMWITDIMSAMSPDKLESDAIRMIQEGKTKELKDLLTVANNKNIKWKYYFYKGKKAHTLMSVAAISYNNPDMVKLLFDCGYEPNNEALFDCYWNCEWHLIKDIIRDDQKRVAKLLLQYGYYLDKKHWVLKNKTKTNNKLYPLFKNELKFRNNLFFFNNKFLEHKIILVKQVLQRPSQFWNQLLYLQGDDNFQFWSQLCDILAYFTFYEESYEVAFKSRGLKMAKSIHNQNDIDKNLLFLLLSVEYGTDLCKRNKHGFNILHFISYGDHTVFSTVVEYASKNLNLHNNLFRALCTRMKNGYFSMRGSTPYNIVTKNYHDFPSENTRKNVETLISFLKRYSRHNGFNTASDKAARILRKINVVEM